MPHKPKFPEACRHLDLAVVSHTLAKHRLDICGAAKELGVHRTDLRRLTWHDPKLLDEAMETIELYRHRCNGLVIDELHSPQGWRRRRAIDLILTSQGHPMARATAAPKRKTRPTSKFVLEMNRRRALKARAIARLEPADGACSEWVSAAGPR
jgi:hypothetical protein